ncbi:hypothetical protein JVU11DRAFT_4875 [Chiua virens]|nr:hypothetical protein JVU11DRAFT_4875 [Chiua virens]
MLSSTTHTRLTRTASDLRALSAILLPPSPILRADNLLISLTSDEIPILLEATTHTCDSPLPHPPGLCDPTEELNLIDKLGATENTRGLTRGDEALHENWILCEELETCTTRLPNGRHAEPPNYSFPPEAVPSELKNAIHLACYDVFGGDGDHPDILHDCSAGDSEEQRDSQTSCPSTTALTGKTTTVIPKEDRDGEQALIIATFHTYSTLQTPTFAPPSPSPSVDVISPLSSPDGRQRHRRPLERARAVRFPGRPRSPRSQLSDLEAHPACNISPSPTNQALYPRRQLADSAHIVPADPCSTDKNVPDTVYPFVKHVALPEEFSWLRQMAIKLWIDQEGFRAVRSSMQLIDYSPRTRSLLPYGPAENAGSDVTAGIAEFMPTKRETFAFHYGTLDGPPVLRMVSVAGDDSRDYISRQATLTVKANGVYTVLGTETFIASILNSNVPVSRLQNVRLRWKFDYLLSDRKVDGTRKILPGEKTLTPLTFSCSPYLFHPLQGKKAGLMHIVKKNLAPKLGSQKLEATAIHIKAKRAPTSLMSSLGRERCYTHKISLLRLP